MVELVNRGNCHVQWNCHVLLTFKAIIRIEKKFSLLLILLFTW